MTESEEAKALIVTEHDNIFIKEHLYEANLDAAKMEGYLRESEIYEADTDDVIQKDSERRLETLSELKKK